MGRVTVILDDRDHLAFKLLSLHQDKKLVVLVQEALKEYLEKTGAYDLSISKRKTEGGDS
jgi:hypothetical protein